MTKQAIYTAFKTRLPLLQDEAIWEAIEMIEDDGGDLVSRQAAIDAVRDGMCSGCWCDVLGNLKNVPSAQPERKMRFADADHVWVDGKQYISLRRFQEAVVEAQPERKTGKWITVNGRLGNEVECDNCHSVFWYWMGNYRFCPSCGADMRGESDDNT